jgi:geranylgeranyl diphosphate/geranylgeranyl-bacteriochlorophyllide a reductase
MERVDVVVVGGGPAGATAAHELASRGHDVLLLDRAGRVKPCGGAVPPRLLEAFDVPEDLLVARVDTARILSPSGRRVDIPVGDGFVGMVDRGPFDAWLRARAVRAGARQVTGHFVRIENAGSGAPTVVYNEGGSRSGEERRVEARYVVGADGALSQVARQALPAQADRRATSSPTTRSSARPRPIPKASGRRAATSTTRASSRPTSTPGSFPTATRRASARARSGGASTCGAPSIACAPGHGLDALETIRKEGAPIPIKPLSRWDNGSDVILAGDAAGVVAPSSGEGIFYAMTGGRVSAEAVDRALVTGRASALARARRRFLRTHGMVFTVLGVMQRFWYTSDARRERFVAICRDRDVQELTFEGYMRKELVRARPMAHARIFFKNLGHLTGVVSP